MKLPLSQYTLQEIFDVIYRGLAAQGFHRSYDTEKVRCAYRSADGCKCAIGQVINDEDYSPELEGWGVLAHHVAGHLGVDRNDYLISALQTAHDDGTTPVLMQHNLADFALRNKLTIPEITP